MQEFYSAPGVGRFSAILKSLALTISSLLFLNLAQVKAQAGNHLDYDGTDDYVTIAPNVVQGITGSYTIEAWVLWRGPSNSAWQRIFDFGSSTSNWAALTIAENTTFSPLFGIQVAAGPLKTVTASSPIALNTWTHIAVTVDDVTDIVTIYINGQNSGTATGFTDHLSDLGPTTNNWIGRSEFGTDPYFNGEIDELRISNNLRYTGNFTPQATQFSVDANTVALYHFNEGSGTTTADATGNFNADLAASPSTPTWATGSILPIKLNSVSANVTDGAVDIKWSASLDRESEFVIERSSNGTNFSPIGSISRGNGTNGFENFSFRDTRPLSGRSFYRLKCTEVGSAPFYSRMVAIIISAKDDFIVYPNPVKNNSITVELAKAYTGNIEFTLTSSSGAVVLKQKLSAADKKEFQIPKTPALVPGIYVLEINTNGIKKSRTIVYQ